MMQELVEEIEQMFTDIAKDMGQMVETLVDVTEDFAGQIQEAIAPDLETQINHFFDPILEAYLGFEVAIEEALWASEATLEESLRPVRRTVEPVLNEHATCVGCQHYHGQAYNGVMFVCGMHPYGWEEENCPDWESTWQE